MGSTERLARESTSSTGDPEKLRSYDYDSSLDRLGQGSRDADVEAIDYAGFGGVVGRQQQAPQSEPPGGNGNRQHAADAVNRSVEREHPEDDRVVDRPARQPA